MRRIALGSQPSVRREVTPDVPRRPPLERRTLHQSEFANVSVRSFATSMGKHTYLDFP